jgi:predicted DNA-binding transcriptional regulator AlpA
MNRFITYAALCLTTFLLSCAGPAPDPEPGLDILHYGRGHEMQVAPDIDWNSYTKVILYSPPVEFTKDWRRNQERLHGRSIRDEDVARIEAAVSGLLAKVMYESLSDRGGYEMTDESGPGVMVFMPNIVDLDVQATGWVQSSILESLPAYRGRMTTELVIRDSVSDKLLAVAWQQQSDPRESDMEMTTSISNSYIFRLMSQNFANWVLEQLDELSTAPQNR